MTKIFLKALMGSDWITKGSPASYDLGRDCQVCNTVQLLRPRLGPSESFLEESWKQKDGAPLLCPQNEAGARFVQTLASNLLGGKRERKIVLSPSRDTLASEENETRIIKAAAKAFLNSGFLDWVTLGRYPHLRAADHPLPNTIKN